MEVGDIEQVAKHLYDLLTNNDLYQKMSYAAARLASKDYLTVPNAICWLFLALSLLEHDKLQGDYQSVLEMARRAFTNTAMRETVII